MTAQSQPTPSQRTWAARLAPTRFALASLCAIGWAMARDVGDISLGAFGMLLGVLSAAMLAVLAFDLAVAFIPTKDWFARWLRVAAAVAIVVPGLAYGLHAYWESRADLPGWAPVALVGGAVIAGVIVTLLRWPLGYARPRWALATLIASTVMSALLIAVHVNTGTMTAVRPGTGLLHIGLFVGTWVASAAFVLPLSTRYAGPTETKRAWLVPVSAAVALVGGAALLEVDRYALVELYENIHVWLGVLGLLGVETAVRLVLSNRRARAWSVAGAAATLMLFAAATYGAITHGNLADVAVRSDLKVTPLGASALQLLPRPSGRDALPDDLAHPALEFDQYLDEKYDGPQLNVLLISIDALRSDALGPIDDPTPRMPALAELAKDSVRFRHAYAQGSRTAIGMSALMMGRYSANIDWNLWLYKRGKIYDRKTLSAETLKSFKGKFVFTTLPTFHKGASLGERLKSEGYATGATPFAMQNEFFQAGVGFDHGIDHFEDLTNHQWPAPSSEKVIEVAIKQQDQLGSEPWFQWVHLYDPHEARRSETKYTELLGTTDAALAKLIERIKARGHWDRTMVIVVADHGEAFGEHRHKGHGSSLYDEQARVPLVIRIPGIPGRDENKVVAVIDATATIAAVTGAPTDRLDGVNLLPLMKDGRYPEERPVFTELHRYLSNDGDITKDLKAVILGDYKLILDRKRDTAELYNLTTDPTESKNIIREEPETFARLNEILTKFVQSGERAHPLPK